MLEMTPKQVVTPQAQINPAAGLPKRSQAGLPGALRSLTQFFWDEKNHLNIKAVNRLLYVIIGLAVLLYTDVVIGSVYKIKHIDLQKGAGKADNSLAIAGKEKPAFKPFDVYVKTVQARDIFRMGPKTVAEGPEIISSKAASATESLRLVGISWSDDPDAMIEDTKAQKTYFLKKGQSVGDITVDAVYKDKVVLRFGAETIDLR